MGNMCLSHVIKYQGVKNFILVARPFTSELLPHVNSPLHIFTHVSNNNLSGVGGGVLPHLYPIILPLVPCSFLGGTLARSGQGYLPTQPGQGWGTLLARMGYPHSLGQDRVPPPPPSARIRYHPGHQRVPLPARTGVGYPLLVMTGMGYPPPPKFEHVKNRSQCK